MVLLGIVPVLMHTPPIMVCFSTTATRFPALASWMAARCPPGPEPITTRSYGCICGILSFEFQGIRGFRGGVPWFHLSIGVPGLPHFGLPGSVRAIMPNAHQLLLYRDSFATADTLRAGVHTIRTQHPSLAIVRQIRRQYLLADSFPKVFVLEGKQYFDTLVQIARHPIRATQVHLRFPAIFKIEDAAVLQKTSHDAAHPDAAADAAQTRHQSTL